MEIFIVGWSNVRFLSNTYFQFKQFTIQQHRCAMKVCTDACLFGAWTATKFKGTSPDILDIGAGTGVLSLMLAQKTSGNIDCIEIEMEAFEQAGNNILSSPWHSRISIYPGDVRNFRRTKNYDLVIANPPFYENELSSPRPAVNMARHDDTLTLSELFNAVNVQLAPAGSFALLLPYPRVDQAVILGGHYGLMLKEMVAVRQTMQHPFLEL